MAISTERARASYADAEPTPFWLDRPDAPTPCSPLDGSATADLAIVGGGYTGLWAAIQAKEEDPGATSCWSNATRSRSAPAGATAGSATPR